MIHLRIFISLGLCTITASASPVITEFLADNSSGLQDEDGDHSDWIEIHNPGADPVELSGWHLTDDFTNLTKWTFPSHILAEGDYLVVFASGDDRAISGSELHTNFALSRSGDYLALVSPEGIVSTFFNYPGQKPDVSYGPTKTGSDLVLINQSSPAKALIPTQTDDNSIGVTWRNHMPTFDDSTWLSGTLGVGFERSNGFQNEFGIDVESAWAVNSSIYIRIPIPETIDPSSVQSLVLRMKYDDGFAAFINGSYAVGANDPANLLWNSDSAGDVTDSAALQFQDFDISASIPDLIASGNLLSIHGMNRFSNSSDLLIRPELIATLSSPVPPTIGFFNAPTPGAENPSINFDALLEDTKFQVGRGIYAEPFTEIVTSTDPGTTIIYTTDGSIPSPGNGIQVLAPDEQTPARALVEINTTTILRTIATRSNALPTNVDTQTYLFHSDVLTQDGAGLPSPSNNTSIWDYEMDPNVVNDPRYPDLIDDLNAIPSLSVSLPAEDMWGQNGIYANPRESGSEWERACSVEYLHPDGTSGFQQDAGIRIQGAGSRFRDLGKKSLRIAFRSEYGKSKLDYKLFGSRGADKLDNIVLRGAYFDSWTVHTSGSGTEYIGRRNSMLLRDEFGRQSHQAMGASPVVQGNWAHVYFNGIYWGLYNLHERVDQHFAEDRFGGDDSEYDVLKQRPRGQSNGSAPEVVTGNLTAWNTLLATLNSNISTQAVYDAVRLQLDVDSFADYLILNFWGANLDWPHNNWYAVRHKPTNGPFTFITWDIESNIFRTNEVGQLNTTVNNSPGIIWSRLRLNDEFMMYFSDRVHKHCFNSGALTPSKNTLRFQEIINEIRPAMNAESARWGDTREEPPMNTIDQFDPVVDEKISNYFPARTNIFINQLKSNNLYPVTAPPKLSQHGGSISPGTTINLENPNGGGTLYFSTDDIDPRLPGGSASPSAIIGSNVSITEPTSLLARIRSNGGEWSPLTQAEFLTGTTPNPGDLIISEIHYHPTDANPEEALAGFTDQDDFEFIELTNTQPTPLDLTHLAFTAGIQFDFNTLPPADRLLPGNGRLVLVRNTAAFTHRYGAIAISGEYDGSLANSGETISLGLSGLPYLELTYNDKFPWPESPDGKGHSLVLTNPQADTDLNDPLNWQASPSTHGSPSSSDIVPFAGNPHDDDNQDGIDNLLHVALTNSENTPPLPILTADETRPVFSFQRNLTAQLIYNVEYSEDLESWTSLDQNDLLTISHQTEALATYSYRAPPAGSSKRQFFRLNVRTP